MEGGVTERRCNRTLVLSEKPVEMPNDADDRDRFLLAEVHQNRTDLSPCDETAVLKTVGHTSEPGTSRCSDVIQSVQKLTKNDLINNSGPEQRLR